MEEPGVHPRRLSYRPADKRKGTGRRLRKRKKGENGKSAKRRGKEEKERGSQAGASARSLPCDVVFAATSSSRRRRRRRDVQHVAGSLLLPPTTHGRLRRRPRATDYHGCAPLPSPAGPPGQGRSLEGRVTNPLPSLSHSLTTLPPFPSLP